MAAIESGNLEWAQEPVRGLPVRDRWRPRWWRRSAGVAVAVAVMVMGSTATASATGPRKPSSAEIATAAAEPADGPVHGEFPVVAADGTVQTRRWQWGQVVAVDPADPTLITVASDDGYAGDYRVAPDQAGSIDVGDVVTVVGLIEPALR